MDKKDLNKLGTSVGDTMTALVMAKHFLHAVRGTIAREQDDQAKLLALYGMMIGDGGLNSLTELLQISCNSLDQVAAELINAGGEASHE